jgi:nitrile hydratase subunit beta
MAPKRKSMPRKGAGGRAAHDVGGLSFGKIDRSEHDLALWEKRTDAMQRLLTSPGKRAFSVDGLRRVIEDYGEQAYDRTTYYEKWIRALRNLVVEQELMTRAEVEARMAEVRARHEKAGRRVLKAKIPW